MNRVLIDAIRRRLGEQSTDQLLALWTTNDRVMWSPEAFEAVKLELVVRGVRELPPQNDPAPLARAHSPALDPATQYWMGWVRPALWVGVAVGVGALPQALTLLGALGVVGWRREVLASDWWEGRRAVRLWLDQVLVVALPLWLLVASVACLRLKSWGRTAMLTYAATAVVLGLIAGVLRLEEPRLGAAARWVVFIPGVVAALARELALPLVLWALFRRPEVRSLFLPPPTTGRAFEPLPVTAAAAPSTVA
jgi:hypothetical protein